MKENINVENSPRLRSYYISTLKKYEEEIKDLEISVRIREKEQLDPEIKDKIIEKTYSKIYKEFGLKPKEKAEVVSRVEVARNRLENIKKELNDRKKSFEDALKYYLEKYRDVDKAIEKYFSEFTFVKPIPDIDKDIKEIKEILFGLFGTAKYIGFGKTGTILITRYGGSDINELQKELASEIGHAIVHKERGENISPSVDEFYDAVSRSIIDPYPQNIIDECALVGEKSLNKEPLTDEDLDFDAMNYIEWRGVPAHHEGFAIYKKLTNIFGDKLPKIAGKALKNPNIDFTDPISFYKGVIREYQGGVK